MAPDPTLSPADRDQAIERLVLAETTIDVVLSDLDQLIHLPGLPRAEVRRLKAQRTRLVATFGVLAGCRARIAASGQDGGGA